MRDHFTDMDGLGFCVLAIICLLFVAFVFSLLALGSGIMGMVKFRRNRRLALLSVALAIVGTTIVVLLIGALWSFQKALVIESHSLNDEVLTPFLLALDEVNRTSLGFTPISPNARIGIEYANGKTYDVMLHVYAETSRPIRTIAFKKVGETYRWIGEQEIHTGPQEYKTVDGTQKEQIIVMYETVRISGIPLNEVFIMYTGDNPMFKWKPKLTLQEVQPVLDEWKRGR